MFFGSICCLKDALDENAKKGGPADQGVRPLRVAFYLAKKVGTGLGAREVLFRALPKGGLIWMKPYLPISVWAVPQAFGYIPSTMEI